MTSNNTLTTTTNSKEWKRMLRLQHRAHAKLERAGIDLRKGDPETLALRVIAEWAEGLTGSSPQITRKQVLKELLKWKSKAEQADRLVVAFKKARAKPLQRPAMPAKPRC
jgi:hypothetical protein